MIDRITTMIDAAILAAIDADAARMGVTRDEWFMLALSVLGGCGLVRSPNDPVEFQTCQ